MDRRGWSLPLLVGLLAAAVGLGAVLVALAVATGAAPDPETRRLLRENLIGWGALLVLGAGGAGALAGSLLAREFRHLRRTLSRRLGGEVGAPLPAMDLVEAQALGRTADLLARELARRAADLERQRDELAAIVDSVSEGLLRTDAGGQLSFANPAARRLLGLPPEAVGQPLAALVRDLDLRGLIGRAAAGETVAGAEIALGERRVLVSAQPLRIGRADAGGLVLAVADLTALRRLEGVRRDFVANVSHELKTPLTSISGYIETLLHDDLPDETRRQFLEVVARNAERLRQIVDELLDLARIESGGWRPRPEELDATDAVLEAWEPYRERAVRQGVAFQPPTGSLRVRADRGGLRTVLGNLFDNALRHTPVGGSIGVRAARSAGDGPAGTGTGRAWTVFEVADTGCGIPAEALDRIFERFYRVDPGRSREAGGTGLGLAIVRHLVESMGGDVSAASTLGRGTTIRFRLPAAG